MFGLSLSYRHLVCPHLIGVWFVIILLWHLVCCHLVVVFDLLGCYKVVLFVILLQHFICVGAIQTGKANLVRLRSSIY